MRRRSEPEARGRGRGLVLRSVGAPATTETVGAPAPPPPLATRRRRRGLAPTSEAAEAAPLSALAAMKPSKPATPPTTEPLGTSLSRVERRLRRSVVGLLVCGPKRRRRRRWRRPETGGPTGPEPEPTAGLERHRFRCRSSASLSPPGGPRQKLASEFRSTLGKKKIGRNFCERRSFFLKRFRRSCKKNVSHFWEACSSLAIARNNKRTRRWPPVARREAGGGEGGG